MRRVLALDLSTKTGWALFEGNAQPLAQFRLLEYGLLKLDKPILTYAGKYPWNVMTAAGTQSTQVALLAEKLKPTIIVIEDTVPGRQALSQRFLEWLHLTVLGQLNVEVTTKPEIFYIKTGIWRQTVGLKMSADDKKNNKIAKKLKELPKELQKQMRKETGVKGRRTKKHLAVDKVNELWKLGFKVKDNDIADAILLGHAYIQGAQVCDGT